MSSGAAAYKSAPTATPAPTIMAQAQEKMLLAAASRFWPKLMDMGTDEPTPIRSASAKLMITNGMLKFSAANAVSPRIRPTNTPSIN